MDREAQIYPFPFPLLSEGSCLKVFTVTPLCFDLESGKPRSIALELPSLADLGRWLCVSNPGSGFGLLYSNLFLLAVRPQPPSKDGWQSPVVSRFY